jgi:hypothetical protein
MLFAVVEGTREAEIQATLIILIPGFQTGKSFEAGSTDEISSVSWSRISRQPRQAVIPTETAKYPARMADMIR